MYNMTYQWTELCNPIVLDKLKYIDLYYICSLLITLTVLMKFTSDLLSNKRFIYKNCTLIIVSFLGLYQSYLSIEAFDTMETEIEDAIQYMKIEIILNKDPNYYGRPRRYSEEKWLREIHEMEMLIKKNNI